MKDKRLKKIEEKIIKPQRQFSKDIVTAMAEKKLCEAAERVKKEGING